MMNTRTPRSPHVSTPLLPGGGTASKRDRRRETWVNPGIFNCDSSSIVWTLVVFWAFWFLCILVLWFNPSLMDPLVRRHYIAEEEARIAREHDGPNHHHGFPGMIILPHEQHHHEGGHGEPLKMATKEMMNVEKITIPGINDGPAATTKQPEKQSTPTAASAKSGSKSSATPSATPPRSSPKLQPATFLQKGTLRATPGGETCNEPQAQKEHQPFEQYSLQPDAPLGSSDDYESDQAPLRQLEVTSVNKFRKEYQWSATTKQKGVLVYMCTSEPDDVLELQNSLRAIQDSFTKKYDYPIAIFHEDYTQELMDRIQASAENTFIYFVKIKFQLPAHMKPLEALGVKTVRHRIPNPQHPTGFHEHEHGLKPYVKRAAKYPYGYQHMCRFFSGAGFMLPFFDDFDWYWRLDSDTICHGSAEFDLFDHLSSCGLEYAYLAPIFGDGGDVVEGLWNAAVNYTEANGIKPPWMHNHHKFSPWGEGNLFAVIPSFNTNCEIASLAFLRSKPVQELHRYLDEKGGYFLHRWGDAPVRFLGISMNIEERKTEAIHGIQCMHN